MEKTIPPFSFTIDRDEEIKLQYQIIWHGETLTLMTHLLGNLLKTMCNTPGVYHQLSSGFKLKHDRLSGDEDVKVNLWK
jgi:hypothetical protein